MSIPLHACRDVTLPSETYRFRMPSQLERVEHRPSRQCPYFTCSSTLHPNPNPLCSSTGVAAGGTAGFSLASFECRLSLLTLNVNEGPVLPMVSPTLYLGPGVSLRGPVSRLLIANRMLGVLPCILGCRFGAYFGPGLSDVNGSG